MFGSESLPFLCLNKNVWLVRGYTYTTCLASTYFLMFRKKRFSARFSHECSGMHWWFIASFYGHSITNAFGFSFAYPRNPLVTARAVDTG